MEHKDKMALCKVLLDDDHGVSGKAYNLMISLDLVPPEVFSKVKATDDRFYLPEGDE